MSAIEKLKIRARRLKAEVLALYLAARHPATPWYAKVMIVAVVAYALSPIDLIPDFIPVLGFLDDLVVLPLGIAIAVKMVPADVMAECRERALSQPPDGSRAGRFGAVVVVLLWLALAVAAAIWAHNAFAFEGGRGIRPNLLVRSTT
jgi:uncharacterized membrane protein YkvA (DUF1232 family)